MQKNQNFETLVKGIEEYNHIGKYLLNQIQLERQRIEHLKEIQAKLTGKEGEILLKTLFTIVGQESILDKCDLPKVKSDPEKVIQKIYSRSPITMAQRKSKS